MCEIQYNKLLPPLLSGQELMAKISSYPDYDASIRDAEQYERLSALTDIYRVYYPFPMSVEIYNKLHLATALSLKKKNTKIAVQQRNDTYRAMIGDRQYHGIIGGADSLTIVGASGIGKTSAIQTALNLISGGQIIESEDPYYKIIPCLQVQCPFDASPKGMILEILRNVDAVIGTKYYERSRKTSDTTDVLIGTVSQVALNHVGLLVIDEIQNVWGRKSGTALMSMIIQLINSSGISIAMVGTEECIPFFENAAQLARRAQGLKYNALPYDSYFTEFCEKIWHYQYVREYIPIDINIIDWLYEHSGGIVANIVSLIHDAQEIAILEGHEKLDLIALNTAYKNRMSFIHKFIDVPQMIKYPSAKQENDIFEETDLEEYQSIIEMVNTAKNRSVDILKYLMDHIHIEEVAVE